MATATTEELIPEAFRTVVFERPLNADDIRSFPDDRNRYEIIGGELFVSAAPSVRHQLIVGKLSMSLYSFLEEKQAGCTIGCLFVLQRCGATRSARCAQESEQFHI